MKAACFFILLCSAASAATTRPAPTTAPATRPTSRFAWLGVYVDSGRSPLAAYQLEVTSGEGAMNVVGIEGGEHRAYRSPPFHDRIEIIRNRVVLAAYSTSADLPVGATRVARIHVEIGDARPRFGAKIVVAGSPDAKPIAARCWLMEGEVR
jgi:hypothetical protein